MPVARPATAPAAEGRSPATAARRAPTRRKTAFSLSDSRRETNARQTRDPAPDSQSSQSAQSSEPVLGTPSVSPNEPPSRRRVVRGGRSAPKGAATKETVSFAAARWDARARGTSGNGDRTGAHLHGRCLHEPGRAPKHGAGVRSGFRASLGRATRPALTSLPARVQRTVNETHAGDELS